MKHKIITFGELLLRISSLRGLPFGYQNQAQLYYGGSEFNITATLNSLGLDSDWVSYLPDSELGFLLNKEVKKSGVSGDYVKFLKHPMAIYFIEQGASPRPLLKVIDRIKGPLAHPERLLINWEGILTGSSHFHTSGITSALSDTSLKDVMNGLDFAKSNHINTSYDFNFRSLLWPLEIARSKQKPLLNKIDILFGGLHDLNLILDIDVNINSNSIDFAKIQSELFERYQFSQVILSQRRAVPQPSYRVIGFTPQFIETTEWYTLSHVDRIGTGDAMAAGFLAGHYQSLSFSQSVQQAAACGALKDSLPGDFYPLTQFDLKRWLEKKDSWR